MIESDTVMGMRFEAQPLVVVEDHMQLSPVVQSLSCNKVGLDKSMFQRLMGLSVCPVCLKLHSHMHPPLSAFPSATFHKGILQNGISTTKRAHIHMCFSTQTDTCTHHSFGFTESNSSRFTIVQEMKKDDEQEHHTSIHMRVRFGTNLTQHSVVGEWTCETSVPSHIT